MDMQTPYDKAVLLEALKAQGILEAEQVVKSVVVTLADWLRSSATLSTTGLLGRLDDFAIPGINYFEKLVLEKLDALEAKVNPPPVADPVVAPQPVDPAQASGK